MTPEERDLAPIKKPSLLEYVEAFLPFKLPRIPLTQTAKNLDKAASKLVLCGADRIVSGAKRKSKVSDAKSAAEIDFIRAGSQAAIAKVVSGDSELTERAIVAAIGERVEAQRNRERIAQIAADELEHDAGADDAASEIDDDWLHAFANHAARVSKEEMQVLWGKVLAGEIRKPSSFSLRTLQALSVIEASEARLIHEHMDLVVNGTVFYVGPGPRFTTFPNLLELESVGVLQGVGSSMELNIPVTTNEPAHVMLSNRTGLQMNSAKNSMLELGDVCALTPFGKELYKLARTEAPRAGLAQAIAKALCRDGVAIDLIQIAATPVAGRFEIQSRTRLEPQASGAA